MRVRERRALSGDAVGVTTEPDGGMRVAPDGTVRLALEGGGFLEVATCPRLDVGRGTGPRRAFLSPGTGRRGPFLAIVEGVPSAVADLFYRNARDELARVASTPGSSLYRAVRAGCQAVRIAARRKPNLAAFGFTAVLLEPAPEPVAFIAQLPPCQMYLVDGDAAVPFPEVPTGRAAPRGLDATERRWEVEIEQVRAPLVHDARLFLVDASVPEGVTSLARLAELGRRQVADAARRLEAAMGAREAVVTRYVRPPTSRSPSRSAARLTRLARLLGGRLLAFAASPRELGAVIDDADRAPGREGSDPARRAALLELEATGRVLDSYPIDSDGRDKDAPVPEGVPRWHTPLPRPPRGKDAPAPAGEGGERASIENPASTRRRRSSAPGALVGQVVSPDSPWVGSNRGTLVPTTFSGTPLDSARYPRASDPRGWLARIIAPSLFLARRRPGHARRRVAGLGMVAIAVVASLGAGALTWRPDITRTVMERFAPPTPTGVPPVPTPTVPILAGKTVAVAHGRFASLAGPANAAGDRAPTLDAKVLVLDDVGDIVSLDVTTGNVTRVTSPTRPGSLYTTPASPTSPIARGLFAVGGALVTRDDGTVLLDPGGNVLLIPWGGSSVRPLRVKSAALWASPVAAVVYGSALYIFDAGSGGGQGAPAQVWRHALTAGGNYDAEAAPWMAPGQVIDLSLASDVATDGAFWVARRDGSVARLAGGKSEVLALKGDALPTRLGAIYTDQGTPSLWVVDEGSRRLISIAKDGTVGAAVDAVLSPGEATRGLWVDQDARTAVVATTGRLVVVPLPQ